MTTARAIGADPETRRETIAHDRLMTGLDYVELADDGGRDPTRRLQLNFIPAAPGVAKRAVPDGLTSSNIRFTNGPGRQRTNLRALRVETPPTVLVLPAALLPDLDQGPLVSAPLRTAFMAGGLAVAPDASAQLLTIEEKRRWLIVNPAGFAGYALGFAGRGDRVEVEGEGVSFESGFFIEFWVRADPLADVPLMAASAVVGGERRDIYAVALDSRGCVRFDVLPVGAGTPVTLSTVPVLSVATWHHVYAAFRSDSIFEIWIDGDIITHGETAGLVGHRPPATDHPMLIFAGAPVGTPPGTAGFAGSLDEVRQWREPRTALRLRADLNRRLVAVDAADLSGYWPLDEGAGELTGNDWPRGDARGRLSAGDGGVLPAWSVSTAPLVNLNYSIEAAAAGASVSSDAPTLIVDAGFVGPQPVGGNQSSTYNLQIDGIAHVDALFSEASFSFDAGEPSDLDPRRTADGPPLPPSGPPINYLAKDYVSFRDDMLGRMAVLAPDWTERNPADLGIVLIEVMAYAADQLSYYQDAAATEAYLGTARQRVSVARHARLLDYPMSNGANARAWVVFEISAGDGTRLPGPAPGRRGTALITRTAEPLPVVSDTDIWARIEAGAQVFETMEEIVLHGALNLVSFYTWDGRIDVLPRGSTTATLVDPGDQLLTPGKVVVLEQVATPELGPSAEPAMMLRHVVRLTAVEPVEDPLFGGRRLLAVTWHVGDALPFDFPIAEVRDPASGDWVAQSVVRGNVVLVDNGYTVTQELGPVPLHARFEPSLQRAPIAQQGQVGGGDGRFATFDPLGSATGALGPPARDTLPAIVLNELGRPDVFWFPRRDLLSSDRFARDFVAEIRDDGRAQLRFGDDQLGRRPPPGTRFEAFYRVGNGMPGNVGIGSISHMLRDVGALVVKSIRNPMPAAGGARIEAIEQVRVAAPEAFRLQERAVVVEDYIRAAGRYDDVKTALADIVWSGSWYTAVLTVERNGRRAVDGAFCAGLRNFLDRYRLAGIAVEVRGPRYVPLEIVLRITLTPGYLAGDVVSALRTAFSTGYTADGRPAVFNPDLWTFRQPVYGNRLLTAALAAPGVAMADFVNFRRVGGPDIAGKRDPVIDIGRFEIAEVASDPLAPENGRIEFVTAGATP